MNPPNESYPLTWPIGWPRTPRARISRAKFGVRVQRGDNTYKSKDAVTLYVGRERLLNEMERLGAANTMLSTNIPTRQDGLPYSKAREPDDHGVAVYFQLEGEPRVLACDRWDRVADNMAALAAHVDAMRGQDRWGVGSLARAFAGYKALPAVDERKTWWAILGVTQDATQAQIDARRIHLLRQHHPDAGGNGNQAAEVNAAYDEACRARA